MASILAVGGGRIMDLGKCLALELSGTPMREFFQTRKCQAKPLPILAVPTTAGSGSEATHFAVLYKESIKQSVAHPDILPLETVVDWSLLQSCPRQVLACSGLDALCQCVESYWSCQATAESREFATRGMALAWPMLEALTQSPDDQTLRGLAEASHLAGKAINLSFTTAAHACSYVLTAHFRVTHGHAVALMLAQLCPFVEKKAYPIDVIKQHAGVNSGVEFRDKLLNLIEGLGLASTLKQMNVDLERVLNLATENINVERLKNLPVEISLEEINALYRGAWS